MVAGSSSAMLKSVVLVCWLMRCSFGMVHSLSIERDDRSLYRIESFCFVKGGLMEISVKDVHVTSSNGGKPYRLGFAMRRSASESAAQQELEELLEKDLCLLDSKNLLQLEFDSDSERRGFEKREITSDQEGLYSLIFARCDDAGGWTSFELSASFMNPGPSHLSACDSKLPALFAIFAACYFVETLAWFALLVLGRNAHYIHWMMGILLVFKTMAMASQSLRYHSVDSTGTGEGWQFVYYVFASLKGISLFVVILLIGTGWSLVKPYLNDRDKYTILVVLCLQVVDNIALVVFEETAPGSQTWLTWRDVLHLVDILCCFAVLFPIVWSIRHLRRAATADGKTRDNIDKLTLFRQFYIMVVSYIYFTRIVVFLLAATLPFQLLWMRHVFSEGATIIFYTVTGLKFRPHDKNPYLPLKRDDDDHTSAPENGDEDDEDDDPILDAEYGGSLGRSSSTSQPSQKFNTSSGLEMTSSKSSIH